MSAELNPLERLLKRDRQVVVVALVSVIVFASLYTAFGVGMGMSAIEMSDLPRTVVGENNMHMPVFESSYMLVLLSMWWVMMIAMMLPSAAPVILLTTALNRRSTSDQPPYGTTIYFTIGYLLGWFIFSLVAVTGQLALESNGLLSSMMYSNNIYLTAGLLLAAGVWQFSPVKHACLRHCRSPIEFITRHRRPGNRGALMMGLHHGTYCLGCCWFLMALLFVGGIMNLYWIAGLALFVVIEKLYSHGVWFGRLAGAGFVITGITLLAL